MAGLFDPTTPTPLDEDTKYFDELVGEGKKFSDPEKLARGKIESDNFILQLQREQKTMREDFSTAVAELRSKKTLEELIDQMKNLDKSIPNPDNQPDKDKTTPHLTHEDIETILSQREAKSREESNLTESINILKQNWGDNYADRLKEEAEKLGLGQDFLTDLAKRQPKAFASILNVTKTQPQTELFQKTQVRTEGMKNRSGVKDWNYYQEIRKKDPVVYHSSAVQNEMFKNLQEMGDSFGLPT